MTDPAPDSKDLHSQIAGSTVLMVARRTILTLLSGLSTILIARLLHPEGYGLLQAAIATWTLVLAFSDFGFTLALGRDFAAEPERRPHLLRAAYEIQAVLSVILTVVMIVLAGLAGFSTDRGLVILVLAPSVLAATYTVSRTYFTAVYDVKRTVKIDLICNLTQIVAMILLAIGGAGAVGVAAAISAGYVVNSTWVGIAARREVGVGKTSRKSRFDVLRRAAPLGLMAVLSKTYITIDVALLGLYETGANLGNYAAASKIVVLLNIVPAMLLSAALPGLSTSMKDKAALRNLLSRMVHWVVAAILPVFVVGAIFSNVIVAVAFGSAFKGAGLLISVLCLAGVLGLASQILGLLLISGNVIRPMLWQNAIAVVLNIGANVILIPRFGAIACAWLTVATEVYICLGASFFVARHLHIRIPWNRSYGALLAVALTAAMGLATKAILNSGLALAITLITMALLYLLLRAWPNDLLPARWRKTDQGFVQQ